MLIKSLYIQNFMSYKEAKINFSEYSGITMIEGKSDSSSRDSNGSGKSTIPDAITYALFGKTLRKQKNAESVINRFYPEKRMLLILVVEQDGVDITIERSRHKGIPLLRVTGLDNSKATNRGMQEYLEDFLGINYKLFVSSIMFGGLVSSFCSMTDSERKKILEEMLEFDYFEDAQKKASQLADVTQIAIVDLGASVRAIGDTMLELKRVARESRDKRILFEAERNRNIREFLREHDDILERLEESIDDLMEQRVKWKTEFTSQKDEHLRWDKLKQVAEELSDRLYTEKEKLLVEQGESRVKLRDAKKDLEGLKPDEHPEICPMCGQRWPNRKDKSALAIVVADKEKRVSILENDAAAILRKINKKEEEIRIASSSLVALDKEEPRVFEPLDTYLSEIRSTITQLELELRESFRRLRDERRRKNPHTDQFSGVKKKLKNLKLRRNELRNELHENTKLLSAYQYWSKAFGKSGIPSFLLDSSIPVLNNSIAEISRILTDGELQVTFNPAVEKGSGSIFEVKTEYADGSDNYDMSSRGEHSRIDLAVLFAIRELLSDRGKSMCQQVFIDELFDGMDDHGISSVMTLLRKRYKDTSFFIVSHNSELKTYADNVISVEKKDGISMILE